MVIAHETLGDLVAPELEARILELIRGALEDYIEELGPTAGPPHNDLTEFVQRALEGLAALAKAEANVSSDPGIRGGATVMRGTRITVHEAADLAKGATLETILAEFPRLTAENIEDAILYAKANPAGGRQRKNSGRPRNMRLVSSTRVTLKDP